MSWAAADLKLAMARLADAATAESGPVLQEVLGAGPWVARIVRVASGNRFEHAATVPCLAMSLGGVGTLLVDDWRATVVPGQLVSVAVGQRATVVADGPEAVFAALLQLEDGLVLEDGTGPVDVT